VAIVPSNVADPPGRVVNLGVVGQGSETRMESEDIP